MPLRFLAEFLRSPRAVGAIAPSSRALARVMVREMGLAEARAVCEYGPGTGAFTGAILSAMGPGALYFAIEQSPRMAAALRARFPGACVFERSAEEVEAIASELGVDQLDAVLCGLPWAAFDEALQDRLLGPLLRILRPGGKFATFAYNQGLLLPAGRRFRAKLRRHFARVEETPTVWRNLPPAFVYRCTR